VDNYFAIGAWDADELSFSAVRPEDCQSGSGPTRELWGVLSSFMFLGCRDRLWRSPVFCRIPFGLRRVRVLFFAARADGVRWESWWDLTYWF
jgi:hypothetical protein